VTSGDIMAFGVDISYLVAKNSNMAKDLYQLYILNITIKERNLILYYSRYDVGFAYIANSV